MLDFMLLFLEEEEEIEDEGNQYTLYHDDR